MRILVLSDIHANLEALEACLAAAPAHDAVWNLGDLVGYGASPNQAVEAAQSHAFFNIRGNHDKACAGLSKLEEFNPTAAAALMWTKHELTPENLDWLRALPKGPASFGKMETVLCAHGSPLDEDTYLVGPRDAQLPLAQSSAPIIFFGHTHVQGGFATDENEVVTIRPAYKGDGRPEDLELRLHSGVRYLINPGSIGQPRDGDPRAAFALFDSDKPSVTFYRIPYNVKAAQQKIHAAGLPIRLALRLSEGR